MPACAQRLQHVERRRFRAVADRHHRDGRRRGRRVFQQHGEALDTGGPADGRRRRAAHLLDQTVVAATTHHRALRAQLVGDELEGGVAVVVEAAHDARVLAERHAEAVEMRLQPRVERGGGLGQVAGDGRRIGHDAAVALVLAVEDAQRVALQPRQAVGGQRALVFGEVRHQGVAVGLRGFPCRRAC